MSGGFPLLGVVDLTSYGATVGTGTALTNPTSANTKSAYTQIVAGTSFDAAEFTVNILCGASTGSSANAFDVAIGPSGSEVVIVPNLIIDNLQDVSTGAGYKPQSKKIGIPIPASTRIAMRFAANNISNLGCFGSVFLGDGGFTQGEYGVIDAIGFNSGSTRGTAIPAGSSGGYGSWTQIVASASFDYIGFFLGFDIQGVVGSSASNNQLDIGIGASGSEQVILNGAPCRFDVNTIQNGFGTPNLTENFMIPIPAGTRIAARAYSTTPSLNVGVTLYGLR